MSNGAMSTSAPPAPITRHDVNETTPSPKPKKQQVKSAAIRYPFWFGGSAASMAAVVTHPLDLGTQCLVPLPLSLCSVFLYLSVSTPLHRPSSFDLQNSIFSFSPRPNEMNSESPTPNPPALRPYKHPRHIRIHPQARWTSRAVRRTLRRPAASTHLLDRALRRV